jgi:multidrug efflux pump subunit AcrA (membrane-fusion protein)
MSRKNKILISLAILVLVATPVGCFLLSKGSTTPQLLLSTATRKELKVMVSTNGIIEPIDRADIFAPFDGFVTNLSIREGSEVAQGQLLARLESQQLMTALAEARAALLQAKNEARLVASGPPGEEVAGIESSIAETALQLKQQREDLLREEDLLKKEASTREAVENLRKQVDLLQVRIDGLKQKREGLLHRHADDEKQLLQNRVTELTKQVELLEQEVQMGSILAHQSGVIYSLIINQGSYVSKGNCWLRCTNRARFGSGLMLTSRTWGGSRRVSAY